jgi:phospholipid/cholesterol/gamma-HCH transport system permease protein
VVRNVADRAFLPAKNLFEQVGDMMILTGMTIVSAIRPPYPYGGEFIGQFLFALQLCWFPMMISTLAFGFAPRPPGSQLPLLFGALDRLGASSSCASIREFAPFVTAVSWRRRGHGDHADLGARKIREELDALRSRRRPDQEPRRAALPRSDADHGLMDIYALIFGIVGGIGAELLYNSPRRFFATLFNNASITDLWGSVLKTTLFGAIIAIVCSYKGMTASGGAEGVGRAVNEAVVIAFMGVFAFNYVFTQTLLATHPELQVIK